MVCVEHGCHHDTWQEYCEDMGTKKRKKESEPFDVVLFENSDSEEEDLLEGPAVAALP